jgi:anti-anti-sigma factor
MTFEPSSDLEQNLVVDQVCDSATATVRMTMTGELDAITAGPVHQVVLEALRQHRPTHIELDVAGITYLDSAGIRALVLCQDDARHVGCDIAVINATAGIYRVLEITGLVDHFGMTPPAGDGTADHRTTGRRPNLSGSSAA